MSGFSVAIARWGQRARDWRRKNRQRFNRMLARLLGGTSQRRYAPLVGDTRRILVIRLNKRLGNILFLTPMLRSLAASLPQARIDVVIKSPAQSELLQSLPGIGRIWIQENRPLALLRLLRDIRREKYDLVIDPTGNSASNRIAMALSGGRQKLAFANGDQWLALTHASGWPSSRHQALQSVELLTQAISEPKIERFDTLAVFPDGQAREAATRIWQQTLGNASPCRPVIGFFSRATGAKMLPRSWWQSWIDAVAEAAPEAVLVEILPGASAPPIDPDRPSVAIDSLTRLAAFMARCSQFVAADSGPMHLAAAAGVPVVGLFRVTSPVDYAPLGQHCLSLSGDELAPARCARLLTERLPRNPR